jgi:hypothetical protein
MVIRREAPSRRTTKMEAKTVPTHKTTHARAAAEIRRILKEAFPDTKFSVRSKSFAGGDAVNIGWTDGPTSSAVRKLTRDFQYGHFDGMIDSYEYSNSRDDIPQVKYVMEQRTISEESFFGVAVLVGHRFGVEPPKTYNEANQRWCEPANDWWNTVIHRTLQDRDLTVGLDAAFRGEWYA